MAKYGADVIPTCVTCDTRNETKSCLKCAIVYCKHFASKIDNRFCANCISDVHVKTTIVEKEIEHQRADGSVTFSRKYQATMIKLEGVDWLFANHLIAEMTDAEIDATIQYHAANKDLMLMERQSRQLERSRKLAGIKIVHSKGISQEEREKAANKKSKVKIVEKDPTKAISGLLQQMAKAGMTVEQLMAALGGVK